MDEGQEIFYCNAPECKHYTKIIESQDDSQKNHNGHTHKSIFELRKELLSLDIHSNPLKQDSNKQELLAYIDDQVEIFKQSFSTTIQKYCCNLKKFINDNLASVENRQLLFKAVIENNTEQIKLYQDHLDTMKKEYFLEQKTIFLSVKAQLSETIESTSQQISQLDKIYLPKQVKRWSDIHKHTSLTVEENQVIMKNDIFSFLFWQKPEYNSILLEPRLSTQDYLSVRLKIVEMTSVHLQICDLNMIKKRCSNFQGLYLERLCAYTHIYDGYIYGGPTFGKVTESFTFDEGDIIEMQWNGPLKMFTTLKVKTGEKFDFEVKFDGNAEIHFAISLRDANKVEIM